MKIEREREKKKMIKYYFYYSFEINLVWYMNDKTTPISAHLGYVRAIFDFSMDNGSFKCAVWSYFWYWQPITPSKSKSSYIWPLSYLKTREPWSSGYRGQLMFERLWVRIPAPYTGWTFGHFFPLICCKICIDCLNRPKINKK